MVFLLQKEASGVPDEAHAPKVVDGMDTATATEKCGENDGVVKVEPVDIAEAEKLEIKDSKDLEKLNKELTKEVEELEKAEKLEQTERGMFK